MFTTRRVVLTASAFLATGLFMTGCSSSNAVKQADVEQEIADQLGDQLGASPDVSCPDDLKAEVDQTMDCDVTTSDGQTVSVTVKVTSVDGNSANFSID